MLRAGLLIKSQNGFPVQSPYLVIIDKQAQLMSRAAAGMGFTPASRSHVALAAEPKEELDPWDDVAG